MADSDSGILGPPDLSWSVQTKCQGNVLMQFWGARARLRLKGRGGAIRAVPGQLQSGHCQPLCGEGGGGYWRLEMRLGLLLGLGMPLG